MKTAIIGEGWVGKSMLELFPESVVYDEPKIRQVEYDTREPGAIALGRVAVNECDVAFVCVPTPNTSNSFLDVSIVEEVVEWIDALLIVIRSTVNPGTTDRLKEKTGKRIVFQPEYLGETVAHPMLDQGERPFMVIGGDQESRRELINLYTEVYNANTNIRQVTALEAEVIKLSENRAIAYKVLQCQELYDACEAGGVDYYTVRDAVYGDDPRFSLWFTFVYPESRGASSKCIPKDVYAWEAWAESVGANTEITRHLLSRNQDIIDA